MKNKGKEYSLTAKERKGKREPEIKTTNEAASEATILGLKKRSFIIVLIAIFTAVVLFVSAILIAVFWDPYRDMERPVAVIRLSNNMQLEFEIYEDETPYAATNFIYLARKGYFNNTVIFDAQSNFIRFGGYTDASQIAANTHRSSDLEFASNIKDITAPEENNGKLFTYRLHPDTGTYASQGTTAGYLSFMQADTATEFQICTQTGAQLDVNNGNESYLRLNAVSFARYLDGNLEKIQQLYSLIYPENESPKVAVKSSNYWLTPTPAIKIESVRIYNLNMEKWGNFNFDDFLASGALWQWRNT